MPGVLGVVDGSHIPVNPPKDQREAYCNRKGWYSVLLSGTVDHRGRFIHIATGFPGRMSDSTIFKKSQLWTHAARLFPRPFCILGDSIYPFQRWLQKGYPRATSRNDPGRRRYNVLFSRTRVVVECAYGKLKGQWRCLLVGLRMHQPEEWNLIIRCCCILHNVSIDQCGQGLRAYRGARVRATPEIFATDPAAVGNQPRAASVGRGAEAWRTQLFEFMCPEYAEE